MAAGDTETVDVVAPVFHEYVAAPLAVIVVGLPAQVVGEVIPSVGVAVTLTFHLFRVQNKLLLMKEKPQYLK